MSELVVGREVDVRLDFAAASVRPEILDWAREQGLDPVNLRARVWLLEDGRVALERYLRDEDGHLQIKPRSQPDLALEAAAELLVLTPTRPLPLREGF